MADTPIPDIQEFQIQYAGGLADQNSIPLDDLIDSLRGFENFFQLTDSIYVQGRLTKRPLPAQYRIDIRVRRVAPGSIIAVLEFVGYAAAAGLIGNASYDFLKGLWRWRVSVLQSRTRPVRLPASIEEIVAGLEALARDANIQPSEEDEDPAEIVQELNIALQDALAPIDHSVERIVVASDEADVNVSLGRAEKVAVQSQPTIGYTPVESGDWEEVEIAFVKIHTETGHALVKFRKPRTEDQKGTKPCTIVDPGFRRANDPFTRTMSRRTFMKAWARKAIFNPETGAFRWEVRLSPPMPQIGLFDGAIIAEEQPRALPAPPKKRAQRKKKRAKRK